MAFKMKGYIAKGNTPLKWDWGKRALETVKHAGRQAKNIFSSDNPYGRGDYRGREGGKVLTKEQMKHRDSNPRKRNESMSDYKARIGEKSSKTDPDRNQYTKSRPNPDRS